MFIIKLPKVDIYILTAALASPATGITFRVELSKDFGTPVSKSLPGEAAVRAQFDLEESGESRSMFFSSILHGIIYIFPR